MIIGVDLDYTLIEHYVDYWILAHEMCGKPIKQSTKYGLSEFDPDVRLCIEGLFRSNTYMNKLISPVPDSQLFVNYLRDQGHNVICITARCESIIDGTRKFLWEQFQITPVFYGFPKKTAMWENGIDIWIDDNEEDCKDAVSLGIETYIIRRSWNENHSIPGVTKFESYRSLRYHFQEKFHGQQECEKREDVRALGSGPVFRSVQAQRATSAMLWGSRPSV